MKKRRYVRIAALALVSLAAAWLLPSLINAERYRRRVQANLQQVLGRPVRFGSISLQILPRPGFSIDNLTVVENRAFGSEAFARVDHVDCDLSAARLLTGHITLARLYLRGADINLVRNSAGQWNVAHLAAGAAGAEAHGTPSSDLAIEVNDARLNFKFGADKKPFAVTGLNGRLTFDRGRRKLAFDVSGEPVRTDLRLPTPGVIQLQGTLLPESSNDNSALNVTLRTRGAMIYDWIPLALNRNPGIYGLMDAEAHVTGSLSALDVDAHARISQLRRWESLPPSGDLPVNLALRARLDRSRGEAGVEALTADFGASHLALRGKLGRLGGSPVLDLTVASASSRLEDFRTLEARLNGPVTFLSQPLSLTGNLSGIVAIRGSWMEPLYSGSLTASKVRLNLGSSSFPVSDFSVDCDGREIRLLPARIAASARIGLAAEGVVRLGDSRQPARQNRAKNPTVREAAVEKGYRFTLSAHSVSSHELLDVARGISLAAVRDVDLQGPMTATMSISSADDKGSHPVVAGSADLHDGTLWLPGLAHGIPVQEAKVTVQADHVLVSPLAASFAGSIITARISHVGPRSEPWIFEARATPVDLGQALSWFEAFGHPATPSWLERIPALTTLARRRAAGTGIFNALNARGEFSTPVLKYRNVSLRSFSAHAAVSKRDLTVEQASFRFATGKGQASADLDLTGAVPHLATSFAIQGLRMENWASHLPPQLAELRGTADFSGRFSADGVTRSQLETNLRGRALLHLTGLDLGRFDPIRDAAKMASWGDLAPSRGPITLRSTSLTLLVENRHAELEPMTVDFGGASFQISGGCDFDGAAEFQSNVDLRHVSRRWLSDPDADTERTGRFLLSGQLNALRATTEDAPAQARR